MLVQFSLQHLHRPLVGNDVVEGQQQKLFLLAQQNQRPAKQRRLLQVEGLSPLLPRPANPCILAFLFRQLAQVEFGKHEVDRRKDDLHGLPIPIGKGRAECFVTLH